MINLQGKVKPPVLFHELLMIYSVFPSCPEYSSKLRTLFLWMEIVWIPSQPWSSQLCEIPCMKYLTSEKLPSTPHYLTLLLTIRLTTSSSSETKVSTGTCQPNTNSQFSRFPRPLTALICK
ncbi:hypothetical protein CHARACLAT_006074 [Characodon lateralis]|uniref:Uncharacterized protein n=1 Tax=Characodon lateralis TaxID=208331 RepID=A0ABU7F0J0_9TELE|nr:hypothetical protein [Characodon lateralis]